LLAFGDVLAVHFRGFASAWPAIKRSSTHWGTGRVRAVERELRAHNESHRVRVETAI
jgi:hypothetical protein